MCDQRLPRGTRTITGIIGGTVLGFVVGGSVWAIFGCIAGLIIGASFEVNDIVDDWQ